MSGFLKKVAYLTLAVGLLAGTVTAQATLLSLSSEHSAPNCTLYPAGICAPNAE
jgi:hypothetical protein